MAKQFGLSKEEKLKSRRQIEQLFAGGKSFAFFPLRVFYQSVAGEAPILQAGFAVSKKHFKKAVDRNHIKRLMREAYRLQKEPISMAVKAGSNAVFVFFVYTGKIQIGFHEMMDIMQQGLNKLQQQIKKLNENPS